MQLRLRAALTAMLSLLFAAVAGTGATATPQVMSMTTPLSGANEVPAVETDARGVAIIKLGNDGQLTYRLNVANIENVLMAHIHVGGPDENGPVVVWLYPEDGPPPQLIEGRFQGTLATGTITGDDLVGPLEGHSLEDLLDHIRAGNAYVNVHTEQHPGGEIRGQIPGGHGPGTHGS